MKKSQKLNKLKVQTLRDTLARRKRGPSVTNVRAGGVKECPQALRRIIEWANLQEDHELPELYYTDFRDLNGRPPESLPDAVRRNILEAINNSKNWRYALEEELNQDWREDDGTEDGAELTTARREWLRNQLVEVAQSEVAADRYALIRGSRAALVAVTSGAEVFPVTTFLKRVGSGKDARATYGGDPISDALFEAELFYIRRCEECGKFFYAQRENQETCPPPIPGKPSLCAGKRRSRLKRKNDKLREQQRRGLVKLKRATPARKR